MKIKTFDSEEEVNAFIDTIKPISLEVKDKIILIYDDHPSPEEVREKKIRDDESEARAGLQEAVMHLQYLNIIADQSEEDAKIVEASIKGCKQNIKNYQAKLKAIELWKNEK